MESTNTVLTTTIFQLPNNQLVHTSRKTKQFTQLLQYPNFLLEVLTWLGILLASTCSYKMTQNVRLKRFQQNLAYDSRNQHQIQGFISEAFPTYFLYKCRCFHIKPSRNPLLYILHLHQRQISQTYKTIY